MSHRIIGRFFVSCVLASLSVACGLMPAPPFGEFDARPAAAPAPLVDQIVITPTVEARPAGGRTSVGAGFLAWIPLVPYGAQHFRSFWGQEMPDLLGDVLTKDLAASGIAKDVFTGELSDALALPGAGKPVVLKTTLHEGVWNRNMTLYCFSIAGSLFWLVGAPVSYGNADLDFTLDLVGADGDVLASQRFQGEASVTEWPYGDSAQSHAFSTIYGDFSPRIRAFVAGALQPKP